MWYTQRQADKCSVPRICFVNKMDRDGADFIRVVNQVLQSFKLRPPVPIQCADWCSFQRRCRSCEEQVHRLERRRHGTTFSYEEIPAEVAIRHAITSRRDDRLAAEANETLMDKYLTDGELTEAEIKQGLRERTLARESCLVCGTAFRTRVFKRWTAL